MPRKDTHKRYEFALDVDNDFDAELIVFLEKEKKEHALVDVIRAWGRVAMGYETEPVTPTSAVDSTLAEAIFEAVDALRNSPPQTVGIDSAAVDVLVQAVQALQHGQQQAAEHQAQMAGHIESLLHALVEGVRFDGVELSDERFTSEDQRRQNVLSDKLKHISFGKLAQ